MMKETTQLQEHRLERLLVWLDSDRNRAAIELVRLHSVLTQYFIKQHCIEPEDLADVTLDRAGSILVQGKSLSAVNREAYLKRVAYYVLHEYWRARKRLSVPSDETDLPDSTAPLSPDSEIDQDQERLHSCLERCLSEILPEERLLLLEYYSEAKTARIHIRNRIATRLGISSSALCQRISKLRQRVRNCIFNCIDF